MRNVGVVTRGIRIPIIHQEDDLENIVVDSLIEASETDNIIFKDNDIIAVTESVLAKSQGNYVSIGDIAQDIQNKFGKDAEIGVVFPIFSRNRFSLILKGIAKGVKKVYLQLSYPNDEVGNPIVNPMEVYDKNINTFETVFNEKEFRNEFGHDKTIHPFTNVDIIEHYKGLGDNIEILFANDSKEILNYTKNVLVANIHLRFKEKEIIENAGAEKIFTLCDILSSSINGSGYNSDYGLLGSNASNEEVLKLFPRDGETFVNNVQRKLLDKTGKHIELMIYGDGAFKDPVAGIWELADPVVSPAYTKGLEGTPSEYKLKYLADSLDLEDHEIKAKIKERKVSDHESLGTTPRRIPDLVGSLADLTSGSGDRGTPVVHIQGYFDNYSDQ